METTIQIVVKEEDLDVLNHVNNSVYVSYLEEGRTDWYYKNGVNVEELVNSGLGTVLRKLEVSYIDEAKLGEVLTIKTWPGKLGRTSFSFEQQIINEKGKVINEATIVNVMIDLKERKSIPVIEGIAKHFQVSIKK